MADFIPSQAPSFAKADRYSLRAWNDLVKRVGDESYTKDELNQGALDTRYYTEEEVNSLLSKPSKIIVDDYTLTDDDYIVDCRVQLTLTLHEPTNVSEFVIINSGNRDVSISGTIQGESNFVLYPKESIRLIWSNGFMLS